MTTQPKADVAPVAWPPDVKTEFIRRIKINENVKHDFSKQCFMMKYYSTHPKDWINDWCVTYDPRLKGVKKIPFRMFPRQAVFIDYLLELFEQGESGLVEKCRDIGATWLCCAFSVWLWIFKPYTTVGWGSRKEEYVDDKGNPKAIFPKIRQIIANLPHWMRPDGYSERVHATYMKILNPVNGSAITGEAGDGIGRGGRTSIYFKDESAHYERPEKIEAALGDNTDVQVDISSVNGSANVFYRRRMAGIEWKPGLEIESGVTRVFIFDWRDHPGKTQEWYDKRLKKAEAEGLRHIHAQEVDRDYSGSVEGIIIRSEWIRSAIDAHIHLKDLGDWFSGNHHLGQDIADGGGDRNAAVGKWGSVVNHASHWGGEAGPAARVAVPLCIEKKYYELSYDNIGVGTGFKVEINHMREEAAWPKNLRVYKWTAGGVVQDPTDPVIPGDSDGESPLNEDQYLNLKAQSYFRTRGKFYKTYLARTQGIIYPVEEMISLSSEIECLHELVMELSQPVSKPSQSGKTMVDKKPQGARSPNLADALIIADNPFRELSILDVL